MDKNQFVKTANVVGQMMEWYWEYGVERKEYTIQPAGLYTLNEVWERQRAIGKACDGKPCVAFWGPSQSGKSTLLSYYIDGDDPDGADSALSWGSRNVRFSPDQEGRTKANTTVFNPQNGRNDASGLVTRFYMPVDDRDVDEEFPISLIPASRKQVLHALAVGYRKECKNASETISAVDIERKIVEKSGVGSVTLDRESFLFVSDLCDVCKILSATDTFFKTYGNEDFRSKAIQSKYASNIDEAWGLAGLLLWDGNEVMTRLAKKIISFSKERLGGCNEIMVSVEAAAKLEDISSLSRTTSEMSGLSLVNEGGQLKIGKGTTLSSAEFGLLQACVGEMRVPLRKTKSNVFNDFLMKHDLLDIPGAANHATGSDVGDSNLVDLTSGDPDLEKKILVKVYKTGKTLSVVYGQAENCSVDSFVVFVPLRREGGVSRPKVIEEGIRAWLAPYMECGSDAFATRPPLSLYINISLFSGELAKELANQRNGLANVTDLRLAFADKKCVDYFFTTNKFMPCNLSPQLRAKFEDDDDFARAYLSDEFGGRSWNALFDDPEKLGTDFMFKVLNGVNSTKRLAKYEDISKYDITRVLSAVADARPQDMDATERRQRNVLEYLLSQLEEIVSLPDQTREKDMAVSFIKCIFDVDYSLLDSIPTRPSRKSDEEIGHYINSQMQKWIANRTLVVSSTIEARRMLNDPVADAQPLLEALTCHSDDIVEIFKSTFSFVVNSDIAREARGPFALMLSNVFATGEVGIARRADVQNAVPIEGIVSADLMIEWFANRVRNLLDHGINPSKRPSLEGDLEIDALANQLS